MYLYNPASLEIKYLVFIRAVSQQQNYIRGIQIARHKKMVHTIWQQSKWFFLNIDIQIYLHCAEGLRT